MSADCSASSSLTRPSLGATALKAVRARSADSRARCRSMYVCSHAPFDSRTARASISRSSGGVAPKMNSSDR
jgi:hypothetical protein